MKRFLKFKQELLIFIPFILLGLTSIYIFDANISEFKSKKEQVERLSKKDTITPTPRLISENGKTEVKEININDSVISPEIIEVDKGSKVVLNVSVDEGFHNLFVDFYRIETRGIPTGQKDTLIFIATQSGSFDLSSSTDMYINEPKEAILIIK